jgi:hypothetical protein
VGPDGATEADGRDITGMPQSVDELLDHAEEQLELAPHTIRVRFRNNGLPRLLSFDADRDDGELPLKYSAIKVTPLP